ncbi:MAG: PAS domain-containing protein [Desulfobulbaceae bacterium]|nr:PAS domain-containing protein [Desulfobulbaceae bacterium]
MSCDLHEIFRLAARHFYQRYKRNGGSQVQLAEILGVNPSYVSAVMSGSKKASLELQSRIAEILYGPFEEFLMVGRRIKNNFDPQLMISPGADESIEKLITRLGHYVSDYHRMEKELVRVRDFYEEIVQNLQSGVIVTDRNDTIFFANDAMAVLTGIPPVKFLALHIFSLEAEFPGSSGSEFFNKYKEAKKRMASLFYENVQVVTPDGCSKYLSGWLIPKIQDGRYNGMTCTIRDTTRSHDLGKLLKLALDNSPFAICMAKQVDRRIDEKTYYANTRMKQLFGLENLKNRDLTLDQLLDRYEEFIVNKKEWRQFLQENCGKKSSTIIIKHVNKRRYLWSKEELLDKEGKHWGMMALVREEETEKEK